MTFQIGDRVIFTDPAQGTRTAGKIVARDASRDKMAQYTGNRQWLVDFNEKIFRGISAQAYCATKDLSYETPAPYAKEHTDDEEHEKYEHDPVCPYGGWLSDYEDCRLDSGMRICDLLEAARKDERIRSVLSNAWKCGDCGNKYDDTVEFCPNIKLDAVKHL